MKPKQMRAKRWHRKRTGTSDVDFPPGKLQEPELTFFSPCSWNEYLHGELANKKQALNMSIPLPEVNDMPL